MGNSGVAASFQATAPTSPSRTGRVSRSSSVPERRSSAQAFMVSAGTKIIRSTGMYSLSVARSARLREKNSSRRMSTACATMMNSVVDT